MQTQLVHSPGLNPMHVRPTKPTCRTTTTQKKTAGPQTQNDAIPQNHKAVKLQIQQKQKGFCNTTKMQYAKSRILQTYKPSTPGLHTPVKGEWKTTPSGEGAPTTTT